MTARFFLTAAALVAVAPLALAIEPGGGAAVSTDGSTSLKGGATSATDRSSSLDLKKSTGSEQRLGVESRTDVGANAEASTEIGGANWVVSALASHAEPPLRECVGKATRFFGDTSSGGWEAAFDDRRYADPAICAIALNEAASRLLPRLRKPGLLPMPDSPAARSLVALPVGDAARIVHLAEQAVGEGRFFVDYGKGGGMTWVSGPLTFTSQNGAVSVSRNGRPFFDADHIDGRRYVFCTAATSGRTVSSTAAASSMASESRDATLSRKRDVRKEISNDVSVTGSSSLSAGK
ncbi:hypothetical protein GH865_12960 [Rhodocyclus tenuis]|uniref:hypothetical protein n=1 Tax=Rhodocyclus gracilis TaxID=2929842 RepID=UPI001298994B|nr:hypothetical protein [Rhodocyclus gracilis]MRD74148.1 hypothetical protein [Rhodocyclus gracilis]